MNIDQAVIRVVAPGLFFCVNSCATLLYKTYGLGVWTERTPNERTEALPWCSVSQAGYGILEKKVSGGLIYGRFSTPNVTP